MRQVALTGQRLINGLVGFWPEEHPEEIPTSRQGVPVQPVDATPYNQLI
jgi:hypothetical protein